MLMAVIFSAFLFKIFELVHFFFYIQFKNNIITNLFTKHILHSLIEVRWIDFVRLALSRNRKLDWNKYSIEESNNNNQKKVQNLKDEMFTQQGYCAHIYTNNAWYTTWGRIYLCLRNGWSLTKAQREKDTHYKATIYRCLVF